MATKCNKKSILSRLKIFLCIATGLVLDWSFRYGIATGLLLCFSVLQNFVQRTISAILCTSISLLRDKIYSRGLYGIVSSILWTNIEHRFHILCTAMGLLRCSLCAAFSSLPLPFSIILCVFNSLCCYGIATVQSLCCILVTTSSILYHSRYCLILCTPIGLLRCSLCATFSSSSLPISSILCVFNSLYCYGIATVQSLD